MKPSFLTSPAAWTRTPRASADAAKYACALTVTRGADDASRWLLLGLALTVAIGAVSAYVADLFPRAGV